MHQASNVNCRHDQRPYDKMDITYKKVYIYDFRSDHLTPARNTVYLLIIDWRSSEGRILPTSGSAVRHQCSAKMTKTSSTQFYGI